MRRQKTGFRSRDSMAALRLAMPPPSDCCLPYCVELFRRARRVTRRRPDASARARLTLREMT